MDKRPSEGVDLFRFNVFLSLSFFSLQGLLFIGGEREESNLYLVYSLAFNVIVLQKLFLDFEIINFLDFLILQNKIIFYIKFFKGTKARL